MIIRNRFLPFGSFLAINLCGIVFVKGDTRLTEEMVNHERIHTHQMLEMLIIPFYIWYIAEWVVRLLTVASPQSASNRMKKRCMDAYYSISFEREAYRHMNDLDYLKRRKRFAWLRL